MRSTLSFPDPLFCKPTVSFSTDDSPDSIHMGSRRRIESPASDGYNGEHIPYVWEEEEEDSGDEAGPSEESDMSSRPHLSANFKAESDAESYVY